MVEALEFVEACGNGLSQGLFKLSKVSKISRKIFSYGQLEQEGVVRDFNSQMVLGRLSMFLHLRKHKLSSLKGH